MHYPALHQISQGLAAPLSNSGDPSDSLVYKVFGCIQWRDENLVDTPHPSMKRFALMNSEAVDDDVLQVLDTARELGALSPVKLIDTRGSSLYLILDSNVGSSTLPAFESLWLKVVGVGVNQRWAVHFASESEIYTGRSDYDFLEAAREILESEALRPIPYSLPVEGNPITEDCRTPRSLSQLYLSDIQARSGHQEAKTLDPYLHTFEAFFYFRDSHSPQMIGRCLNEPERHPTEPSRWAHMECARCGNAMIPLRSKLTDMPMSYSLDTLRT
jgi:hypothetical protein